MELHVFVNRERENLFLARQRGGVMAFIPDRHCGNTGFGMQISIAGRP